MFTTGMLLVNKIKIGGGVQYIKIFSITRFKWILIPKFKSVIFQPEKQGRDGMAENLKPDHVVPSVTCLNDFYPFCLCLSVRLFRTW